MVSIPHITTPRLLLRDSCSFVNDQMQDGMKLPAAYSILIWGWGEQHVSCFVAPCPS